MNHLRPAVVLLLLFTALTGIVYPLALTAVASALFPWQAGGEPDRPRRQGGRLGFDRAELHLGALFPAAPFGDHRARPKDAAKTIDAPYNAMNSGGSNLGPTSKALVERVKAGVEAKRRDGWTGALPADALTTSASGLDPDISPANALAQAPAVARARGMDEGKLRDLVLAHVERPALGLIGERRVNVLLLNLALDDLK